MPRRQRQPKRPIVYRRDHVTIETADKIKLEYRVANPLLRLGAYFIDLAILVLFLLLILYLLDITTLGNQFVRIFDPEKVRALYIAFVYILIFTLRWGYYLLFEMLFEGKTPGKFICGIRTIHYQGKPLDMPALVLRNFARVLDMDLSLFLGGFICMLINREYRRIGDLLANTIVVKDERTKGFGQAFAIRLPPLPVPPEMLSGVFLHRLTEEELYVLRRFLTEQAKIPAERRSALTADLARAVREKIQDSIEPGNPLVYLLSVYRRHEESHAVQ